MGFTACQMSYTQYVVRKLLFHQTLRHEEMGKELENTRTFSVRFCIQTFIQPPVGKKPFINFCFHPNDNKNKKQNKVSQNGGKQKKKRKTQLNVCRNLWLCIHSRQPWNGERLPGHWHSPIYPVPRPCVPVTSNTGSARDPLAICVSPTKRN